MLIVIFLLPTGVWGGGIVTFMAPKAKLELPEMTTAPLDPRPLTAQLQLWPHFSQEEDEACWIPA